MNIKVKNYIHKVTLKFELTIKERWVQHIHYIMDFLIDGQISSFCPGHHEGKLLTLINATQTHSIFVKL